MVQAASQQRVFLSYSHRDRQWVDRLAVHLRMLAPALSVWSDAAIKPGDSWQKEIEKAISAADVAILLLSADYLASDFIADQELPFLTESALRGKTLVVPIVVSPFYLPRNNPLWKFQWVNPLDKPLSALQTHEQDEVFREVARVIERWLTHPPEKSTQQLKEVRKSTRDAKPASQEESVAMSSTLAEEISRKVVDLLASGHSLPTGEERSTKVQVKRPESNLVFVVTSFNDDMEPIYEGIAAAARSAGLEAKRVKDVPGDYRITDKILEMILSSRLVVADLSYERPNVYFELGYARGMGKTLITIARRDTKIHFDVKDWTYIPYSDSRTLERDLKERFAHELER